MDNNNMYLLLIFNTFYDFINNEKFDIENISDMDKHTCKFIDDLLKYIFMYYARNFTKETQEQKNIQNNKESMQFISNVVNLIRDEIYGYMGSSKDNENYNKYEDKLFNYYVVLKIQQYFYNSNNNNQVTCN